MSIGEGKNSQALRDALFEPIRQARSRFGVLLDDFFQIYRRVGRSGALNTMRISAATSSAFLYGARRTGVLLQVELAALPGNPAENGLAGFLQAGVVIMEMINCTPLSPAPPGFAEKCASELLAPTAKPRRPRPGDARSRNSQGN